MALHWAHTTFPQARQWWRLSTRENSAEQEPHIVTRVSGTHTGAASPSLPRPLVGLATASRLTKVAFLLL